MRYTKRTLEQFRVEFQKIYGKEPTPNEFQQFLANKKHLIKKDKQIKNYEQKN